MPLLDLPQLPVALLVLRIFLLVSHLVLTIGTLLKRKSFNAVLSMQTFFDVFLSVNIIVMQWMNIVAMVNMNSSFVTNLERMRSEETRNETFLLRGFGYRFQSIMLFDGWTIICAVTSLCCMMRASSKHIDQILTSMNHGYPVLIRATSVWLMNNIGLCLFNIAIYGGTHRRYSDFLNAYTATLYS